MKARVVVLADDRTGALETAGALARFGRPVLVEPFGSDGQSSTSSFPVLSTVQYWTKF